MRENLGWKEYAAITDDGRRYEVLDGRLLELPSPNAQHQLAVGFLLYTLFGTLQSTGRGKVLASPMDVELSLRDIVQPDILYVSTERLGIIDDHVQGAPDLAVEVLSKSTRKRDRGIKAQR